jgi:hypothetical protein
VKPPDLDRIRFVTRHFNELKGLTLASVGLLIMSSGVPFLRGNSIVDVLSVFGFRMALVAGGFVLARYAKAYYQRIGEVQSLRTPVRRQEALSVYSPGAVPWVGNTEREEKVWLFRRMLLIGGLGVGAYVALRTIGPTVSIHMPTISGRPFFATCQQMIDLLLGTLFLCTWIRRGRRLSQSYYLVLGLVMLALPALGATLGFVMPEVWGHPERVRMLKLLLPPVYDMKMGALVCGACLLVAGLLDHWQLVRVLGHSAAAEPV